MVNFDLIVRGGMEANEGENLAAAYAAVGLGPSGNIPATLEQRLKLSEEESAESSGLAACAMSVLGAIRAKKTDPAGWRSSDHFLYEDLYTRASGAQVERLAYEIIAWASVIIARLMNADLLSRLLPTLGPDYEAVPRLTRAAWYPNPSRTGAIVNGIAEVQRYWDGQAWTERVRFRSLSGWRTGSMSLHAPPTD
jgi:Protein of unknown function (DUF2510)